MLLNQDILSVQSEKYLSTSTKRILGLAQIDELRRVLHFIFYENLAAASIEVRLAL